MNFFDNNFPRDVFAGTLGNLFSALVVALLGYALIDQTKLRPWIYKIIKPTIVNIIQKAVNLIFNKYSRIGLFLFSLIMVNLAINKIWFSIVSVLIVFSFAFRQKFTRSVTSSDFSDGFHRAEDINTNWRVKTGSPRLDNTKGLPQPSLILSLADPPQATNTFLLHRSLRAERGIIECDAFLNPESLLNIVFLCDSRDDNWHMARYDTRNGTSDGFVIKDGGPGANWRLNVTSGTRSTPGIWYRIKVEFSSERARMFRNGELLAEIINPQIFGSRFGFFNECGDINIDNLTFTTR